MDQSDAVGVNDPEHYRGGQEGLRPVLMGREETKQPRPLGEPGKQRPIIFRQPPIERTVAPTFQGMEQPQSDHRTGPEVGLGVFGQREVCARRYLAFKRGSVRLRWYLS